MLATNHSWSKEKVPCQAGPDFEWTPSFGEIPLETALGIAHGRLVSASCGGPDGTTRSALTIAAKAEGETFNKHRNTAMLTDPVCAMAWVTAFEVQGVMQRSNGSKKKSG